MDWKHVVSIFFGCLALVCVVFCCSKCQMNQDIMQKELKIEYMKTLKIPPDLLDMDSINNNK